MRINYMFMAISVLSIACGQAAHDELPIEDQLKILTEKGRLHRYQANAPLESMYLTNPKPEISAMAEAESGQSVAWIRFDIEKMPDLSEASIRQQLQTIQQEYGDLLADLVIGEWLSAPRFVRTDETRVFVNYVRYVQDIPVRDNTLQLVFMKMADNRYRMAEIVGNISGSVPIQLDKQAGTCDEECLMTLTGRADIEIMGRYDEWLPLSERADYRWQRVTVFEWMMDEVSYKASVSAADGSWLDAYPLTVHAKPVVSRALERSYADTGTKDYPLAFSEIDAGQGAFFLGAEALVSKDFKPSSVHLNGPRAMILEAEDSRQSKYKEIEELSGVYFLSEESSRLAAVNAFVSVQRINRYARQFLTEEEAPFLDKTLIVNVNLIDKACNAFYSPRQQRLLLYKEGQGCANMALLNDVIYHEWGHALDDHVGRSSGIVDGAFSEGVADVVSAYYNADPMIAPYFFLNDPTPIRDLSVARSYPRDKGQMHFEGGIIGSTFWELRQKLIERYGQKRGMHLAGRLFFRHLIAVDSYLESYAAVLRVDDEDQNPATPSPNHCLINKVFANHGLATDDRCEDTIVLPEKPANDLNLMLSDAGPELNAVHLLASSLEAEALAFCQGTRTVCLADRQNWLMLDKIGSQVQKTYFKSAQPVLLNPLGLATLIRLSSDGEPVASREIKIFAK